MTDENSAHAEARNAWNTNAAFDFGFLLDRI